MKPPTEALCLNLLTEHQNNIQISEDNELKDVNIEEIVMNLGGINSIIALCLSNQDYCKTNVAIENVNNLRALLSLSADQTSIDTSPESNTNQSQLQPTQPRMQSLESIDSIQPTVPSVTNIHEIQKFYKTKTIFNINSQNNLYFKYFSFDTASNMYKYLIIDKKYVQRFLFFMIFLFIIGETINAIATSNNDDSKQLKTIPVLIFLINCGFSLILIILYFFAANINILWIIFNSFDFRFIIINLIILIISESMRISTWDKSEFGKINPIFYIVFGNICLFILLTGLFLYDSIYISLKFKLISLTLVAFILMYGAIYWFFTMDENNKKLNWNPFQKWNYIGKYSNINFKNIGINAIINLMLFMFKPLFSVLGYKLRLLICQCRWKCNCNCNFWRSGSKNELDDTVIRSTTVYKRPHFKWTNMETIKK